MIVVTLARKPLSEANVAANTLAHGCGSINVDGCRVGYASTKDSLLAMPGRAGADAAYDASSYHVSYKGRALRDFQDAGGGASRFFKQVGGRR